MNKNRTEGGADQGERAKNRKALVIKGRQRRSGGICVTGCVPFSSNTSNLSHWDPQLIEHLRNLLKGGVNSVLTIAYFDRLGVPRLS
ncbi:hypothetical protein PQR02_39875 [Paraburkholderia sediminicola]|uniref:Uncharacterized protein n=1 Tax=Paraburkholderia rhynchosiae TaxID=487049 RepID=A0ACC7NPE3_9BURK